MGGDGVSAAAYRKHRKWVWLKQFLLLLLRMLAIAAVVAMLAHLVTRDQLHGFSAAARRIILSCWTTVTRCRTKSDRDPRSTGPNQVLTQLATRAMAQDSLQKFTVLRFSRAARAGGALPANDRPAAGKPVPDEQLSGVLGQIADVNAVRVGTDFDMLLEDRRRSVGVSQLAVGPTDAIVLSSQIIEQSPDERAEVYVVSDFAPHSGRRRPRRGRPSRGWKRPVLTSTWCSVPNGSTPTWRSPGCTRGRDPRRRRPAVHRCVGQELW